MSLESTGSCVFFLPTDASEYRRNDLGRKISYLRAIQASMQLLQVPAIGSQLACGFHERLMYVPERGYRLSQQKPQNPGTRARRHGTSQPKKRCYGISA